MSIEPELREEDQGSEWSQGFSSLGSWRHGSSSLGSSLSSSSEENATITMSSPKNSLEDIFSKTSDCNESEYEHLRLMVPRDKRGANGKDRNKVKEMATSALEPKIGIPKQFVIGDGETEDGADRIQDSFFSVCMRSKRLKIAASHMI